MRNGGYRCGCCCYYYYWPPSPSSPHYHCPTCPPFFCCDVSIKKDCCCCSEVLWTAEVLFSSSRTSVMFLGSNPMFGLWQTASTILCTYGIEAASTSSMTCFPLPSLVYQICSTLYGTQSIRFFFKIANISYTFVVYSAHLNKIHSCLQNQNVLKEIRDYFRMLPAYFVY